MHLDDGPHSWGDLARGEGEYFLGLVTDSSWVSRRVERLEIVDFHTLQRRVSIDIDVRKLKQVAKDAGVVHGRYLHIPIAILEKGLLSDIDVAAGGEVMSIATSDRDAGAAQLALLALLESEGFQQAPLSVQQKIFEICISQPTQGDAMQIKGGVSGPRYIQQWRLDPGLTVPDSDVEVWKSYFANLRFVSLLSQFTVNYMLICRVPVDDSELVVKMRYLEPVLLADNAWRRGLLHFDDIQFVLDASAIGRAAREHIKVIMPEGIQLDTSVLFIDDDAAGAQAGEIEPAAADQMYRLREQLDRALFYTRLARPGAHKILMSVRPQPNGFAAAGLLGVSFAFAMVLAGFLVELLGGEAYSLRKITENSSDSAVALMLVIPSVFVAYIARAGEHALREYLLRPGRIRLLAAGASTFVCALTLVAGLDHVLLLWIWGISAAINAYVAIYLIQMSSTARANRDQVVAHSKVTETRTIIRF